MTSARSKIQPCVCRFGAWSRLTPILLLAAALAPTLQVLAQETAPRRQAPTTRPTFAPGGRIESRGGFGGEFGGGAGMNRGPQVVPSLGTGPTCTLDATVYDLRLPPDQIGRLDPESLTKAAATSAAFEKALVDLGTSRPLYRASQSVRLSGDTITIGTEAPYVTNSRLLDGGQTINTVQYSSVGVIFNIAGRLGANAGLEVDLRVELSSNSESATAIASDIKAPMFRRATMSHKGIVQAHQPFVLMSIDASSLDANGKAVAYVTRVTLGAPQPIAGAAPGQ